MIVSQDKIRPAIKETETIEDLQKLISMCFDTLKEDKGFVEECASEIYYRQKQGRR